MPLKDWCRNNQPIQLYIILILTILFFLVELVVSHITHALTLLMNSYQMLVNIMALVGCIVTMKWGKNISQEQCKTNGSIQSISGTITEIPKSEVICTDESITARKRIRPQTSKETKLKNTFGWARIDVVSLLICCVFVASLCFSVLVEALQTLVHIDHMDEMHHPISVICIGVAGLLLNGICYAVIGGYTFHQGSFLYVTETGEVVLNRVVVSDSIRQGGRRLSRTRITTTPNLNQRQGFMEMLRDVLGCVFVIVCAVAVYFTKTDVAKYLDPLIAVVSACSLVYLSYPYMKESCLILLQTMPGSLNIDSLKKDLMKHFPDIVTVHDFHVWQLTANKVISTVHIIFQNPKVYGRIIDDIKEFFFTNGITQVTVQPEFFTKTESLNSLLEQKNQSHCFLKCQRDCEANLCCPDEAEALLPITKLKSPSKETLPGCGSLNDLRAIQPLPEDSPTSQKLSSVSETLDSQALLDEAERRANYLNKNDIKGVDIDTKI